MSQETLTPDSGEPLDTGEQRSVKRRVLTAAAACLLVAGSGMVAYEHLNNEDPCASTVMKRGDQSMHFIHLPDGSLLLSSADFNGGAVKVSAGGITLNQFVRIVPAEEVKGRPTLSYDVTAKTQVAFHVTQDVVTTSCHTADNPER